MNIHIKSYYSGKPICMSDNLEISKGLTILIGVNGAGKSTVLKSIRDHFKSNGFTYQYLNAQEEFLKEGSSLELDERRCYSFDDAVTRHFKSEHEHYNDMFYKWISVARYGDKYVGKDVAILIDGLDSGADPIINREIIRLFKLMIDDANNRGINLYLVATCNNFDYLSYPDSYGEMIVIPSLRTYKLPAFEYSEYYKYIELMSESHQQVNRRYENK